MEVTFTFLCDYADNSGGKLTAVGIGIDTVYAASVPVTHRSFYAVIALRFTSVEVGTKQIALRLVDADGHDIVPGIDQALNVPDPMPGYTYRTQRIVIGLGNVRFEKFGDYAVVFLVNGQEASRTPLKLALPPQSPTTS